MVSSFNSRSYCGYTDWTVNVAKDVTGKACDGDTMASAGTTIYDIFTIYDYSISGDFTDGHEIGDLNFGETDGVLNGSSPDKRPIALTGPNYKKR